MRVKNFFKKGLLVLLLGLLASCTQTIESRPFFDGSFTGEYFSPDDTAFTDPLPIRLETSVREVSTKRYTVEGTVTLEGTTYALMGSEDATEHLEHLMPQVAPINGSFRLEAKQGETMVYTLQGDVIYGTAGLRIVAQPPRLLSMSICQGSVCSSETLIGKVSTSTFNKDE